MKNKKIRIKLRDNPLEFLESKWPGRRTKEIKEAFAKLKKALAEKTIEEKIKMEKPAEEAKKLNSAETGKAEPCSALSIVRQTCTALDLLFLGKRITYHIASASDLQSVFVDPEQMQAVFSELFRRIVKRMPHGSRIDVAINEVSMRQGRGIEINLKSTEETESSKNLAGLLKELFGEGKEGTASSLFTCREIIAKQGGQLSVDLPKPKHPVYKVVLPTVGTLSLAASDHQTFKYEIFIKNIANIRKRFGIKKSYVFISQIENYVRALVRHPIDIVMAHHDQGVITAIYDTAEGTAHSVASRISQRLGSEEFKIGKKTVEVNFKYQLSPLTAQTKIPSDE